LKNQSKRITSLLKTFLVGVIPTLIIFILFEILFRIFPIFDTEYAQAHNSINWGKMCQIGDEWGWYFLPNTSGYMTQPDSDNLIKFSFKSIPGYENKGMRDDGFDSEKEKCTVVFGDSYTFGFGIKESEIWCERIEKKHEDIDYLNLANGGGVSKALDQYKLLKDNLPSHQTVIYAMWLGNEFIDNYSYPRIKNGDINRPEREKSLNHLILKSKLLFVMHYIATSLKEYLFPQHFSINDYVIEDNPFKRLYYNIKYALYRVKIFFIPEGIDKLTLNKKYTVNTVKGIKIKDIGMVRINPENIYLTHYLRKELDEITKMGIENTKNYLLEFKRLASPAKFILFLIPFREQVYADIINKTVVDYLDTFDPLKPNKIISQFCVENSIEFYDLTPEYIKNNDKEFYFSTDPHFNSVGANYFFELTDSILTQDIIYNDEY
jgi:hypothetical protein